MLRKSFDFVGAGLCDFAIGEVLFDVRDGAEKALLFAGPEADADGAAHFEAGGLEDANGFDHDGRTSAVVCGSSAGLP